MKKIQVIAICTILIMLVNIFLPVTIYASTTINDDKEIINVEDDEKQNTENTENIENTENQNQSTDNIFNDDIKDEEKNEINSETDKEENILEDEEIIEETTEQEEFIEEVQEETIQTYSNLVIEDGIYVIRTGSDENMVLDIDGGSNKSGANLQIWSYNDKVNQQRFRIRSDGNGYYTIQAVHSGKVLDVENASKSNGTNVRQYDSNKTDAQKWQILDLGNGQVSFVSKCNNLYLDIAGGEIKNGANVQVYEGNNTEAQKFILEKNEYISEKTLENGIYTIKSKVNTNKVLDIADGSTNNSANVQVWGDDNVRQQKFRITYNNEGYYKIEAVHSGKVLDIANGGMTSGTNVQQYEWNKTEAQKWVIEKNEDGTYSFRSILNGYYLDVAGGTPNNGTNIQVYEGNKTNAQKFEVKFEGEQTIENGIYKINTKLNANMYLNVTGSNVNILTNENYTSQKFYVEYQGEGYYTIQSVSTNKVLDVANGNINSGANVQVYDNNKTEAQKWIIKDAGNGYYYITSRLSLCNLDVSGGTAKDRQNIQAYESNSSDAQKFKFVSVEEAEGKQTIEDGIYHISTALNTNYVLDISGGSDYNKANLQIWTNTNVNQQKFLVEYQGDGYYKIQALHSGKVLDVDNGANKNGTNVWQYESNNTNPQRWMIKDAGNGEYYIISKCNGLYLDVSGGKAANGTNVQVYEGNETDSQKFTFLNAPLISNNTYRISTALNSKSVLDVSGGSKADGANIQIWMSTNVSQQNFKVEYLGEEEYKITAEHSGMALTVKDGNVIQSTYIGSDAQKWEIMDAGNGYYHIISKLDGRYLDVDNAQTANGTNVKVYEANDSDAQRFKFENLALKGIDVSQWNGLINWEYVKRSGIEFAMIRIGYRGYGAEGNFAEDPYFQINMQGAKNAGLKVGVYFFTQAVNRDEAIAEANWVIDTLNKYGYANQLDYPIAIDTEKSGAPNDSGRADNLDVATRTTVCKAFCETIQQNGYIPMIYASRNWFYDNLNMNELNQFDIWLAQYNDVADYTGHYEIWQHTSKGTILGISGNVDLNIGYKIY